MNLAVMKIFIIFFSSILVLSVSAIDHNVGGVQGWSLESNVQNWTSTENFYTGDNLVFQYGPNHDVLEVDQGGFATCDTSRPIRTYNDENTVILLDQAGSRYFICGTRGHCGQGLKIQVTVLNSDDRLKNPPPPSPPSPKAPSPISSTDTTPNPPEPHMDPYVHPSSAVQTHIASLMLLLSSILILFLWDE